MTSNQNEKNPLNTTTVSIRHQTFYDDCDENITCKVFFRNSFFIKITVLKSKDQNHPSTLIVIKAEFKMNIEITPDVTHYGKYICQSIECTERPAIGA